LIRALALMADRGGGNASTAITGSTRLKASRDLSGGRLMRKSMTTSPIFAGVLKRHWIFYRKRSWADGSEEKIEEG
jgi:hypothetical protein